MNFNEIENAIALLKKNHPGLECDMAFPHYLEVEGDENIFRETFLNKEMDPKTYEERLSNYRLWYGLYLELI